MTSEQFKAWRAAQKLSQADLADALDLARETITKYERAVNPVPKTVELACAAIQLGVRDFDGLNLKLHQFRLVRDTRRGWEVLELPMAGRRSMPEDPGVIEAWLLDNTGLKPNAEGIVTVTDDTTASAISLNWF